VGVGFIFVSAAGRPTMSSSLKLVSEQFPHLRDRVLRLFEQDAVFQELCQDYEACRTALSRAPASQAMSREYTALRLRLEYELLRYMNDSEPPDGES
jgi:hypothetical protein